jgi:tetratricopeptide (TPR) repeat protein
VTEYLTPGSPFGEHLAMSETWAERALPWTQANPRLPEDMPIIRKLGGSWNVFDIRPGGMGEVYLCLEAEGPRLPMALKSFPPGLLFDPVTRRAFQRECAVAVLASQAVGVLPVLGIEVYEGRPFVMMHAVLPGPSGEVSLRDVLRDRFLPLGEAVSHARIIAHAMQDAGSMVPGLVHGDLKPENLLLVAGVPFVTDFGLARFAASELGMDALPGTPEYQAPEADDPSAVLSVPADVYSYGVILTEMITGQVPAPGSTAGSAAGEPTTRALLDLAAKCRSADPARRPQDFTEVLAELELVAPEAQWPIPAAAAELLEGLLMAAALRTPGIAHDLVRLQQYDMVLKYIEQIDEQSRGWQLWQCQGSALSLTGNDAEALVSYERAYQALDEDDTEQAWKIGLEEASSLKRLGRFEQAEDLLWHLIQTAPDQLMASYPTGTLAALYIETEEFERAEPLLQQLLAVSPTNATAWVNRAVLRLRTGDPHGATEMLRKAVAAEPGEPEWHARLGAMLMDELGLVEDAAEALEHALACGSLEHDAHGRALACALVMDDQPRADNLRRRIGAAFGQDWLPSLERFAQLLEFWLQRKFGEPAGPAAGELPAWLAEALRNAGLVDPLAGPAEPAAAAVPADVQTVSVEALSRDGGLADMPAERATGPAMRHVQMRLGAAGFAVIDVYQPFDAPDYVETFMRQHRMIQARAVTLGWQLADTPFLLMRCPECAAQLATNRRPGSTLSCQSCRKEITVAAADMPELDGLASALSAALGRLHQPLDGWELVIILQPRPAVSEDTMRGLVALLERYSVTILPASHSGALMILANGWSSGAFRPDLPWLAGRWSYPPGTTGAANHTPDEIGHLIEEGRLLLRPAAELASSTWPYDRASTDTNTLLLQDRAEEIEKQLTSRPPVPADAPIRVGLADLAAIRGDRETVARHARGAIAADSRYAPGWILLGAIWLAEGDLPGAAEALERALRLDPANHSACQLLASCYGQQGRDAEARSMAARARALGGFGLPTG